MALTLSFNIVEKHGCKDFTVEDTTGIYDATTNTTGWGAPNLAVGDETTVTLDVTEPGATSADQLDVSANLPNTASTKHTVVNTDLGLGATTKLTDGIYEMVYTVSGTFNIGAVSTGSKTFTITGLDRTGYFVAGVQFTVASSTGNDGTYTVVSSTLSGSDTVITVSETIADATADGTISFEAIARKQELFACQAWGCVDTELEKIEVDDCDCLKKESDRALEIATKIRAAQYLAKCGKVNKAKKMMTHITNLCGLKGCSTC